MSDQNMARLDPGDPVRILNSGVRKHQPKKSAKDQFIAAAYLVWVLSIFLLPASFLLWTHYTHQSVCRLHANRSLVLWDVVLVRPDGVVADRHTVMSYLKPELILLDNGQTKVGDYGRLVSYPHDWERQIVAPVGWRILVEESYGMDKPLKRIEL